MMMLTLFIVIFFVSRCSSVIVNIPYNASSHRFGPRNMTCGVDNLPRNIVSSGRADIESFPWLGLLIYPYGSPSHTTTIVILITTQMAVASALDIDYFPKKDFRLRSRVILGNKCVGPFIRVRDYSFHPDFSSSTYSSLALLQLETKNYGINVHPICPPPEQIADDENIYALTLVNDCHNKSMVMVYKMEHVDETWCRDFYRRLGLDILSMWPSHLVCARTHDGNHCIWRSGTALVIRDDGQWKLLGVGIYGPGCDSPARFMDYGMYRRWVRRNLVRVGQPSMTRIGKDHLILRRRFNHLQRFGKCDPEETKMKLFTDRTTFVPPRDLHDSSSRGVVIYNVTLLENVNYNCVILQVWNVYNMTSKPVIALRRWCNPEEICVENERKIFFYVEISFKYVCTFQVSAYGASVNNVDIHKLLQKTRNDWSINSPPRILIEAGFVNELEPDY